jgi:hypothetical protein
MAMQYVDPVAAVGAWEAVGASAALAVSRHVSLQPMFPHIRIFLGVRDALGGGPLTCPLRE